MVVMRRGRGADGGERALARVEAMLDYTWGARRRREVGDDRGSGRQLARENASRAEMSSAP